MNKYMSNNTTKRTTEIVNEPAARQRGLRKLTSNNQQNRN